MARKTISELTPTGSVGDDDLLVVSQNGNTKHFAISTLVDKVFSTLIDQGDGQVRIPLSELGMLVRSLSVSLDGKVTQVAGKTLSSNDYTSGDKAKVDAIQSTAQNNYIATNSANGLMSKDQAATVATVSGIANIAAKVNAIGYQGVVSNDYIATNAHAGIMSKAQAQELVALRSAVDGITTANAFGKIKVSSTTFSASSTSDTLEIAGSSRISVTPAANSKKITIDTQFADATASASGLMTSTHFSLVKSLYTAMGSTTTYKNYYKVKVGSNTYEPTSGTNILAFAGSGTTSVTSAQSGTTTTVTINSGVSGSYYRTFTGAAGSGTIKTTDWSVFYIMVKLGATDNYVTFTVPSSSLTSAYSMVNYYGGSTDGYVRISFSAPNSSTNNVTVSLDSVYAYVSGDGHNRNENVKADSAVYIYGIK